MMNKTIARRVIKATAMQNMQGNWLRSFALVAMSLIIPMLILGFMPIRIPNQSEILATGENSLAVLSLFIPRNITARTIASFAVTVILYLLVTCPFSIGVHRFYLKVARGEKGTFRDVFSVFTNIRTVFASIWLNIILFFMAAFWSFFLMFIPGLLMGLGLAIGSDTLVYLSYVLLIAAVVFLILWTSRYNFARYIFADRGKGAFSSVRDCIRLLSGRNGEVLTLRASYFGWDIASGLVPAFSTVISAVYNALFSTVYAKYIYYFTGQLSIGEQETPSEV